MKELSIFIDESGDFGCYSENCPNYIISMIMHEQNELINNAINILNDKLLEIGLIKSHTIHTAPLIRREKSYKTMELSIRKKIFDRLYQFIRNINIKYKTIIVDKKQINSVLDITKSISKQLAVFIRDNLLYFSQFDNIIIYYDNGQIQLTNILVSIFNTIFDEKNIEFRSVAPYEYKLFQVADFICTIELITQKIISNRDFTSSELKFFKSKNYFRKNYLKTIEKLKF